MNTTASMTPAASVGAGAIKGEGEQKAVLRTRVRSECTSCGEPATKKHTFLLPRARSNPLSAAYGKDDCTWCSDHEVFSCDGCSPELRTPHADGYEWCSTFSVQRIPHMFLVWQEKPIDYAALLAQHRAMREALEDALAGLEYYAERAGFDFDDTQCAEPCGYHACDGAGCLSGKLANSRAALAAVRVTP